MKWTRSPNGIFAGVCEGLATNFNIEPWLLRFILLFSVFILGSGLLLYIGLTLALPRNDKEVDAKEAKILGVCYRISRYSSIEIGLVRFFTLFLSFLSGGIIIVIYFILHFTLKPVDDDITI